MLKKSLIILCLLFTTYASPGTPEQQIQSLVDAEKAFALLSVQEGIRASFLKFFANDGIAFSPTPVNAKEFYAAARPAGKGKVILDWSPTFSDISTAGDMGYNTGPYTVAERETGKIVGHGQFFSVWRRQKDGTWKVALDIGVQRPEAPQETSAWRAADPSKFKGKHTRPEREAANLKRMEEQLADASKEHGLASAYRRFADADARLHTSETIAVGQASILKLLRSSGEQSISVEPLFAAVANSGDLGYTYGKYTLEPSAKKGFFAHVWKRNKAGRWMLVADVINAESK